MQEPYPDCRCTGVTTTLNFCPGVSCSPGYRPEYTQDCRCVPSGGGGGGGGCFVAGTKVLTPNGEVAIEQIAIGDKVFSVDPDSLKLVPHKVIKLHRHNVDEVLRVAFSNGTSLQMTPPHRFFDPRSKEYKAIAKFKAGDEVLFFKEKGAPSQKIKIAGIETLPREEVQVFNLTLDGEFKNYLSGGVLVHNLKDAPGGGTGVGGSGNCRYGVNADNSCM
ncbi:MAG: Hint domain-containing protein [Elusimicrobia bacterium]|nr:Hint domain-containing protein [Elusimicrobiota bacterium]